MHFDLFWTQVGLPCTSSQLPNDELLLQKQSMRARVEGHYKVEAEAEADQT